MTVTTKYDYGALEQEFITSLEKISIRQLGRKHGIPDSKVSSLHAQARQLDAHGKSWYDKREEYLARAADQSMTLLAAREAKRRLREATVVDHAIDLIDEALISAKESVQATVDITDDDGKIIRSERKYRVNVRDVTALIDRLSTVFGRAEHAPSTGEAIHGNVNANVNIDAESPAGLALLARLAGLTGTQSGPAQSRTVAGAALPDAPDPR